MRSTEQQDWPGVVERAVGDAGRRGLHVDVVADVDRILAAQLELRP